MSPYNNTVKFARKKHGLDAAHKTRCTTYLSRYALESVPQSMLGVL